MNERGSIFPILAIVLVGGALASLIAIELGRLGSERRAISFAADMAAEAGAAILDEAAVREGGIALDPPAARESAAAYIAATLPSVSATVDAAPTRLCITVTKSYEPRLLRLVGASSVELHASACAAPASG